MIAASKLTLFLTPFPSDPQSAQAQGLKNGLNNRDACEVSAWCWELAAQVEALAKQMGLRLVLIGGTAAQLRVAVGFQRGSRDDDYLTDASPAQIASLMFALSTKFAGFPAPQFRPEKKIPGAVAIQLPMVAYEVVVPALLGHIDLHGLAQHVIKLEFHFVSQLPPAEAVRSEVFALVDPVEHTIPKVPYQIAMKLMTLAEPPIGLPPEREDDLPKHASDLDALVMQVRTPADWAMLLAAVNEQAGHEIKTHKAAATPPVVLEQIVARLEHWALSPTSNLLAALDMQLTKASRLGPWEWRSRFRKLKFFVGCTLEGAAGGPRWFDAFRAEEVILSAGNGRAEHAGVAAQWPDRHNGQPMPKLLTGVKASQVWWEMLAS